MGLIVAYASLFLYAVIPWLLYRRRPGATSPIASLVYAAGVSLAVGSLSVVHYALLLATNAYRHQTIWLLEMLMMVAAGALIWRLKLPSMRTQLWHDVTWPMRHNYGTVAGRRLLVLLVLVLVGSIGIWIWMMPRLQWDIWITWEQHARFLVRDNGQQWRALFVAARPEDGWFRHTDYPFLWPLAISRLWGFQGGEWVWAEVGLIGISIWGMLVAVLVGTHEFCESKRAPIIAGLIVFTQPVVFYWIGTRYAEGPLATYMLLSVVLYSVGQRSKHASKLLIGLSFALAGCALWTKNEGALYLLVFSATALWYAARKSNVLWSALWSLPFVFVYLIHKAFIAPPGDLSAAVLLANYTQLANLQSHRLIGAYVLKHTAILMLGVVGILSWAGVVGLRRPNKVIVTIVTLQFVGYVLIYLLSPHPPAWHLPTSFERLWFHLLPLLTLAIMTSLRFPDQDTK